MNPLPVDKLIASFEQVVAPAATPASEWVAPYAPPTRDTDNQFALFLKPEATAVHDGVKLEVILNIVSDALQQFDVETGALRVLNGDYLYAHSIMDQHYGVINRISKGGLAVISDEARQTLDREFKEHLDAGTEVLGGHEFIDQYEDFSALALTTLNDNIGTVKLAGGTYAMMIKVNGRPVIILNPFHAYQLVPYTSAHRAIIVMECTSETSWADLRGNLAGATDPLKAAEGSIRNQLLKRQSETGMVDVSQGANGIHLSAGPLEGMVELQRFLSEPEKNESLSAQSTAFGTLLSKTGKTEEQISALAENPDVEKDGKQISVFDLTEERDAGDAAQLLATV